LVYGFKRRALRAFNWLVLELSVFAIRGILLADVGADLLQFEPDGRYGVTAGSEVFTREVSFFTGQARHCDGTFAFQKPDHGRHRVLGWNGDAHVNMVWHQVPLDNLTFLLLGEGVENCARLPTLFAKDGFPAPFGHEHNVVLAVPFRMGQALIKL
jgi:hypothetical protein